MKKAIAEIIEKPSEVLEEVIDSNENEFGQAYCDFLAERNTQNQLSEQHDKGTKNNEKILKELFVLKPIEKNSCKRISVQLPLPLYEKITEISNKNKLSKSRVIRQMIELFIKVIC